MKNDLQLNASYGSSAPCAKSLSLYLIHQACIQVWCSVLQCAVGCRCSALQGVVAVCCAVSLCNSYIYPVCKCVAVRCSALKCVVAECCKVSLSTSYIKPVFKCAASCSVMQCVAVCCSALQCLAVCCSVLQRVVAVFCTVSLSTSYIKPVSKCAAVCCSAQLQCLAECLSLPHTSRLYSNALQCVAVRSCSVLQSVSLYLIHQARIQIFNHR